MGLGEIKFKNQVRSIKNQQIWILIVSLQILKNSIQIQLIIIDFKLQYQISKMDQYILR